MFGKFDTPLSHFMGYKVICHPEKMLHSIQGPNGEIIEFERWRMEEDKDYMQAIVDVVQGWTTANPPITITNSTIPNSTITSSKPDLRDVSTRDLLNEAYRRGAIKQMKFSHSVNMEFASDPEYMKHIQTSIIHDSLIYAKDKLLEAGVFHLSKGIDYTSEYFICKHPLTLKKEGDDAIR